jgi:hypothetical protein
MVPRNGWLAQMNIPEHFLRWMEIDPWARMSKFNAIACAKRAVVDRSNVDLMASRGTRLLVMGARTSASKGGNPVALSADDRSAAVAAVRR